RHVEQFLAKPPDVHQHDDCRKRSARIRVCDKRIHASTGGGDIGVLLDHCSWMFALLMTGPHTAFSRFMRSVSRSGRPPRVLAPSNANCFFASSVLRNASRMRLIFVTISGGVPAGAARPVNVPVEMSATPLSRTVGTPGRKSTLSSEVTAITLADLTC